MLPLLYVVRMDVEPAYLHTFVGWYQTRHAPDLIRAGFHSCNAYRSRAASPFICNVYEIPTIDIFSSALYTQVRKSDPQLTDEVLHKISNHSNTIFNQEVVVGVPPAALQPHERPSRLGAVAAPVIATLSFDIAESCVAALRRWFIDTETAIQSGRQGWLRARLARQGGKHPMFPSREPQWLVLTEWASIDTALCDGTREDVIRRYTDAFGADLTAAQYDVAALSVTLLNANSWTA